MIEIIEPKLVTTEVSGDKRYGKFVWEPLERGYGITLGNSLRRVLLSSLPGAAVIGVMTVMLWFKSAKDDKPLKFAWLAVTLSFAFYLPVVLWSQMLPKTCMYIWLILMFKNAGRSKQRLS